MDNFWAELEEINAKREAAFANVKAGAAKRAAAIADGSWVPSHEGCDHHDGHCSVDPMFAAA